MMPVFNQCTDYPFCSAHTHPVYCAKVVGTQNAHNLITISTDGKERIGPSYVYSFSELGTLKHCRDNVTMFSGQNIFDNL